jgi:hypothetical protein
MAAFPVNLPRWVFALAFLQFIAAAVLLTCALLA